MLRLCKLLHVLGWVLFLGSILTFILISIHTQGGPLGGLVLGRRLISSGTDLLTLPGLWMITVTGLWMSIQRSGPGQSFVQIKLVLAAATIINAHSVVRPAARSAMDLAARSRTQCQLLPAYRSAYVRESIAGSLNVAFTLAAAAVGVWKPRGKAKLGEA